MGCSSANSSGAGTNMLTMLGADNRLDLVAPEEAAEIVVNKDKFLGARGKKKSYSPLGSPPKLRFPRGEFDKPAGL